MRISTSGYIAVIAVILLSLAVATPTVQIADAHGDSHDYTLDGLDSIELEICACGNVGYRVLSAGTESVTLTHADGEDHIDPNDVLGVVANSVNKQCIACQANDDIVTSS